MEGTNIFCFFLLTLLKANAFKLNETHAYIAPLDSLSSVFSSEGIKRIIKSLHFISILGGDILREAIQFLQLKNIEDLKIKNENAETQIQEQKEEMRKTRQQNEEELNKTKQEYEENLKFKNDIMEKQIEDHAEEMQKTAKKNEDELEKVMEEQAKRLWMM